MERVRARIRLEFTVRRSRNPHYSLRAFARDLGIGSGRLSELLSGKRAFTVRSVERISRALKLSQEEFEELVDALEETDPNIQLGMRSI